MQGGTALRVATVHRRARLQQPLRPWQVSLAGLDVQAAPFLRHVRVQGISLGFRVQAAPFPVPD